ncbi:MAG: hypothetical protein ACRD4P_02115 [Bryobacteraceae bacterium]
MASTKVTFTLDAATISRMCDAADRLSIPKSAVVREAIAEFHERIGLLSERERLRLLRAFDEMVPRIPLRDAAHVKRELREIRESRRSGGRRSGRGTKS